MLISEKNDGVKRSVSDRDTIRKNSGRKIASESSKMCEKSKLSKDFKNGIGTLVGQAVVKLWIKAVKILF